MRIGWVLAMVGAVTSLGCSTGGQENQVPLATATVEEVLDRAREFRLDGSASSDPDGDDLTYLWTLVEQPEAAGAFVTSATSPVATLNVGGAGHYAVALTVSDGLLAAPPVLLSLDIDNSPPEALLSASPPTVRIGEVVLLDGSASSDPDGDGFEFDFTLESRPEDSSAGLTPYGNPARRLIPDVAGEYRVRLRLTDRYGSSVAEATVTALPNLPPVADAGPDRVVPFDEEILLDASASYDPEGDPLEARWRLLTAPEYVRPPITTDPDGTGHFSPPLEGAYTFELTITAGGHTAQDQQTLYVTSGQLEQVLDFQVVDAEYSRTFDALIMVSTDPPQLHIFSALERELTSVPLPRVPTAVSVGPYGGQAAVGHDGWISVVDLFSATVVQSLSVPVEISDLVLGGEGYVYAFSRFREGITTVDSATGYRRTTSTTVSPGTRGILHPATTRLYTADGGVHRYDLADGWLTRVDDVSYVDPYQACQNLWVSGDGDRIFTACGIAFSGALETDRAYLGRLQDVSLVAHLDQHGGAHQVALIHRPPTPSRPAPYADDEVVVFDDTHLQHLRTASLPHLSVDGTLHPLTGRFVFFDAAGSTLWAVARTADEVGVEALVAYSVE